MRSDRTDMLNAEKEIVMACKSGDSASFGKLYDHYIRPIYNFIYFKTFHKETAEDLTSQTFLKALDKIKSFDVEKPFGAWLYQIARNNVIDHYRKRKHQSDIDDFWDLSDGTDVESDVETKQLSEKVRKEMEGLSRPEREIIIMRVWQDLSYKEIAEILGKTEGGCKMSFSRAISKLKKLTQTILALIMLIRIIYG